VRGWETTWVGAAEIRVAAVNTGFVAATTGLLVLPWTAATLTWTGAVPRGLEVGAIRWTAGGEIRWEGILGLLYTEI
jgi:hypothetical protein